jgi:hypothetical protein
VMSRGPWEDGPVTDGEGQGEARRDVATGGAGGPGSADAASAGRRVPRVSPRVAVASDGDALVVAQLDRSALRRLEGTAAELWARVDGVSSVDDLVAASLRDHPEADGVTVREDVTAFVEQLRVEGLVDLTEATAPDDRDDAAAPPGEGRTRG